jgi:hypothetical protein
LRKAHPRRAFLLLWPDAQQIGLEEWDLANYRRFVAEHVTSLRDWYRKRARVNRLAFRGASVLSITPPRARQQSRCR